MFALLALLAALFAQVLVLHGPVTALAVEGDQLLIGQGDQLLSADITPRDLFVTKTVDIHRGAIRAIAATKNGLLILSESGLTALDAAYGMTDFAAGGGQRMIVRGNRVYVASLQAGVTIYTVESGKLQQIGHIETKGSAEDLTAEGSNWLWVAEGDQGFRLYDLTNPAQPIVLFWSANLQPARLIRVSGTWLYLSYANRLAILDTTNIREPRLMGEFALGGEAAFAGDMLITRSGLIVGRVDVNGADVLLLDVSDPRVIREMARSGENGSGDHIVLHGNDLFSASERSGFQRFHMVASALTSIAAWKAESNASQCADAQPINPQPANLSKISVDSSRTVRWDVTCPAKHYEVWINGEYTATVDKPEYTLKNDFPPNSTAVNWQVVVLNGSEKVQGPRWSFDFERVGFLTSPQALNLSSILYTPPHPIIVLGSPLAVLAATCAAILLGLLIVIVGASLISAWFERRRQIY